MTRNVCPVCHGRGTIRNPKSNVEVIPYNKDMTCPNCNGKGFVGVPDNLPFTKPFYRT